MLKKLTVVLVLLALAGGGFLVFSRDSRLDVTSSREVAFPPAKVWREVAEVWAWPRWWPGLETAEVNAQLLPGTEIRLGLKGDPERSLAQVVTVLPARELAWSRPGVLGSRTVTRFELRPTAAGTTVVVTSSILGPQAILARATGREAFSSYQQRLLDALAAQLESRANAAGAAAPRS
ncbi:SRPBCC family protein [Desulfuromonas sp. DDH964]|uniref:SRPBCC family protein n=1 Tax=Desulfuromonas sp. DDH964 TaxID=1823759 RepID=UPI00078DC946|nr:SRPBCC domain-containing protein [Desulfuromonas sp. DDH964]AMV71579.1 hypothetical protein DBW_1205 [Desulfuromonas sp. DDH964]